LGLVDAGVSAGAIRHGPVPGASVGRAVDAGTTLTRLFAGACGWFCSWNGAVFAAMTACGVFYFVIGAAQ
jgi:hypothetical protein